MNVLDQESRFDCTHPHAPMNKAGDTRYSPKLARLLRIREMARLRDLVPSTFPVLPLEGLHARNSGDASEALSAYTLALRQAHPHLLREVEEACGPVPWIVRSAGVEDQENNVNAGGYESLICDISDNLYRTIAEVALSGYDERARQQQTLVGQKDAPEAISCFIQPLLPVGLAADIGHDQSPYLDAKVLEDLEAVAMDLMQSFGFAAIDCEWGLETDLGLVSITTIMSLDPRQMNASHTIGFGFASAQSTGSRATSLALRPAGSNVRLWRGMHLRATSVLRVHLLQARPAQLEEAYRDRQAITDSCHDELRRRHEVERAALISLGRASWGHSLVAPDLMTAWRRYLELDDESRTSLAVVLVDEGSAEEHAGIMFRQQKVTCLRGNTRAVPAGANCVVFERGVCIFGDVTMLRAVQAEVRRELVMPDECAVVFFDNKNQVGAGVIAQLQQLPLDFSAKERLLALSEQPHPDRWIEAADGAVESPSLFGHVLRERTSDPKRAVKPVSDFARAYEKAFKLSRGLVSDGIGTLAALSPHARELASSRDLRTVMALLACDENAAWVSTATMQSILSMAAAEMAGCRREAALFILSGAANVQSECARLPIYGQQEQAGYLSLLTTAFGGGLTAADLSAAQSLELPIPMAAMLAAKMRSEPSLLEPVNSFRQAVIMFKGVELGSDAAALSGRLNQDFSRLQSSLSNAAMHAISEQLKGSLIEAYDASLKGLLIRTVAEGDESSYRRYLSVMQYWISFSSMERLIDRDRFVLAQFRVWLEQWASEPMPESFEIEDRNWRLEFDGIRSAAGTVERYENPHVLHNLLHQWSLARLQLSIDGMPQRVQELERFCSTFSSRSTKVLRFERELLEIQIPMGTHKASYVLTPRQLTVEWTEPPNCPSDEIARVLAFELLLDRFREWMFPALTVRREQIVGTWTLYVRLRLNEAEAWRYEAVQQFVAATRFLFDASYDFSYVGNDAVEGLASSLERPGWDQVFAKLVEHRLLLDDTAQYVALHTLPMSSTVGAIAQSAVVRGMMHRCLRRGPDYCWGLIRAYGKWLQGDADPQQWRDRYELLRQACFFMAAVWPETALDELVRRKEFDVGDDLVAACLFKRTDTKQALKRLSIAGAIHPSLRQLILRHAPEIAAADGYLASECQLLAQTGTRFRRAKQFVAASMADHLEPSMLGRLLEGMDTIPWGLTAAVDQTLQEHLRSLGQRYRFDLDRGVDWATLDSWATELQERPDRDPRG